MTKDEILKRCEEWFAAYMHDRESYDEATVLLAALRNGPSVEPKAPQPLSETERDIRGYIADAKKYGFLGGIPVAQVEVLLQELDRLRFPDSRQLAESSFTVYESSSEPELRHYRAMIDRLLSRRTENRDGKHE